MAKQEKTEAEKLGEALKALDMLRQMLPEMVSDEDDDAGGYEQMLASGGASAGREF